MYKSVDTVIALDRLAKCTGLLKWMRGRCRRGITVLMYHKVLPEQMISKYPMRNLVVESSVFRSQMTWLKDRFEIVTLREAIRYWSSDDVKLSALDAPLACVTFDDGYLDNYRYAAPILDQLGVKATFFVTTDFVDGNPLWFDRAAYIWRTVRSAAVGRAEKIIPNWHQKFAGINALEGWIGALKLCDADAREKILAVADYGPMRDEFVYSPMNWEQIRELENRGHEIGSHSVTHPILTRIDDSALRFELEISRSRMNSAAIKNVVGICYPNGNYDARVMEFGEAAGYQYGCSVERGLASPRINRMGLPRRAILSSGRPDPLSIDYEAEVVGFHDFLRNLRKKFRN